MPEIACKFHEYEIIMDEVERNIYECPTCGALVVVGYDPRFSNPVDGVSWELTWLSRGTRLEDVA